MKSSEINDIVIIGDSFIALELCGWLTTGLDEKKNVSVLMRSNIPMKRKLSFEENLELMILSRYFRGTNWSSFAARSREKRSEILCECQCN